MSRRILIVITVFAIAWPVCALARMREDVSIDLKGPRSGGVRVAAIQQNTKLVNNAIDQLNTIDPSKNDISGVSTNKDGTISSVSYSDGTTVQYTDYSRDTDGKVNSLTIISGQATIKFSSSVSDGKSRGASIKSEEYGDKPIVLVSLPDEGGGLNDIARNPLPLEFFKKMNEAIDKLSKARESAMDEFKMKTKIYYSKVEEKLSAKKDKLASEGVFVYEFLKEADAAPTPTAKRKVIEEAVEYLYTKAQRNEMSEAIEDFLVTEKDLRDKIIVPEMQIYEGKVESALKYLYSIIDEFMKAKLALFMDAKKDKIDAIINLPKKK